MSLLNTGDSMISIATTQAQIAGLVLPPAQMIGFEFKLSTGKAANIDKAGQSWRDAASQVEKAMNDLRSAVSGIPGHHWTGDDRDKYGNSVEQVCQQLSTVHGYLTATGIALTVFGYALFTYDIFAMIMGTVLDVMAGIMVAAMAAGPFGAPVIADLEAMAATCLTVTTVATAILAAAASMVAAVFQGGALIDAAMESKQGNTKAFGDLKKAEEVGSAAALANLAQNGVNAGLAYANRVPKGIGTGSENHKYDGIDLDADRDKDHTWNVGGGGTWNGITGGAHVKYGDRGFMGEEINGGYRKDGYSATGKAGVYVDHDGNRHVYGGATAGYEQETNGNGSPNPHLYNGWGGNVGGNVDYNIDKNQVNGDGSVNVTNHGGTVYGAKDTVTHDDKGNVVNTPEVNTPVGDWRNGRYYV